MRNQGLLELLLCFNRVVVPTARCFSSDSYGGSVTTRSTEAAGMVRSQSTASIWFSSGKVRTTEDGILNIRTGQTGAFAPGIFAPRLGCRLFADGGQQLSHRRQAAVQGQDL